MNENIKKEIILIEKLLQYLERNGIENPSISLDPMNFINWNYPIPKPINVDNLPFDENIYKKRLITKIKQEIKTNPTILMKILLKELDINIDSLIEKYISKYDAIYNLDNFI